MRLRLRDRVAAGCNGDCVEEGARVGPQLFIARHVADVAVETRGGFVVVAGTDMKVAHDTVGLTSYDDAQLGMRLEVLHAIDHLDLGFFEFAGPFDIASFIKAALSSTMAVTYLPRSAARRNAATIGLLRLVR